MFSPELLEGVTRFIAGEVSMVMVTQATEDLGTPRSDLSQRGRCLWFPSMRARSEAGEFPRFHYACVAVFILMIGVDAMP